MEAIPDQFCIFKLFKTCLKPMYQTKYIEPNLSLQTCQTKLTKLNLPNQTYQTKSNLAYQAYWTKPTKPKLLVKAVIAWVRSAFGIVSKLFNVQLGGTWSHLPRRLHLQWHLQRLGEDHLQKLTTMIWWSYHWTRLTRCVLASLKKSFTWMQNFSSVFFFSSPSDCK